MHGSAAARWIIQLSISWFTATAAIAEEAVAAEGSTDNCRIWCSPDDPALVPPDAGGSCIMLMISDAGQLGGCSAAAVVQH
jgi:hypothetical protein